MEDKQIIIDGEHDMNYCEDNNCKHYGNKEQCEKTHCYYRCYSKLYTKLKRKEQECEELKKLLKVRIEDLCDSCGASSMMPMPCKVYEKTLTEIKEIAERDKEFCIKCNGDKEIDCIDCIEGGRALLAKQILQKISECEVAI